MDEAHTGSISIVLPAFNEAENLNRVVKEATEILGKMLFDWEVIVVDDGSCDATFSVAQTVQATHPERIKIVRHPVNLGYGAALRSGFQAASKSLLFFTDSDGQFSFEELPQFVNCLRDNDMVLGERTDRRDRWHRKLNSQIGNFLARAVLGVRVRDINCAYKLFRTSLIKRLSLASDGALINTELLAIANRLGWSYVQVPVRHFPRTFGTPTGARLSVIARTFVEYFALRKRLDSAVMCAPASMDGFTES